MRSNDTPITKSEEEQFYGVPITEHDINCAVRDQLQALDADDCAEVAYEYGEQFISAMWTNNPTRIGELFIAELKAVAQRRANRVLGLKEQA